MTEMDGSSHQSETCQEGLFWQRDESIHSQPGRISANREMLAALVLGWSRLGGTIWSLLCPESAKSGFYPEGKWGIFCRILSQEATSPILGRLSGRTAEGELKEKKMTKDRKSRWLHQLERWDEANNKVRRWKSKAELEWDGMSACYERKYLHFTLNATFGGKFLFLILLVRYIAHTCLM